MPREYKGDEDLLNLAREMAVAIAKSDPNLEGHPLIVAEVRHTEADKLELHSQLISYSHFFNYKRASVVRHW